MNQPVQSTTLLDHPLADGNSPPWATAWGQDQHGIFADFTVVNNDITATQRMRWIPAGRFMMGSHQDETGHRDNEGPQHEVTITRSFWMFDTPCTQRLWRAVMGENESRFVDDERPVENMSWDLVVDFTNMLTSFEPLLDLRLPTEAEWEYACRGGRTEATYAGPMEVVGLNNAPILDDIAWYGGNSGVDFDLNNGHDSSTWRERQFDHQHAGTRKVGLKKPNPWGLFDMLGNVWEWCSDWQGEYQSDSIVNPSGPSEGRSRVLRGGSWRNTAQGARSAYRSGDEPGNRLNRVGFRCAQVHEG